MATTSVSPLATTSSPSLNHPSLDAPVDSGISPSYTALTRDPDGTIRVSDDAWSSLTVEHRDYVSALLARDQLSRANTAASCRVFYRGTHEHPGCTISLVPTRCRQLGCRYCGSPKGRFATMQAANRPLALKLLGEDFHLYTFRVMHPTPPSSAAECLTRIVSAKHLIKSLRRRISASFAGDHGMLIAPRVDPHTNATIVHVAYMGPDLPHSWLNSQWRSLTPAGSNLSCRRASVIGSREAVLEALDGLLPLLSLDGATRADYSITFQGFRLLQAVGTFRGILHDNEANLEELPADAADIDPDDPKLEQVMELAIPCPQCPTGGTMLRLHGYGGSHTVNQWQSRYPRLIFNTNGPISIQPSQVFTERGKFGCLERHGPN